MFQNGVTFESLDFAEQAKAIAVMNDWIKTEMQEQSWEFIPSGKLLGPCGYILYVCFLCRIEIV